MEDTFYKISKNVVLNNLINLKQLVFEVTDACNLHCKYCAYAELYEGNACQSPSKYRNLQ